MSEEKKDEVLDQEKEVNMDELDAVAGGGTCACPFVGGGTASEGEIPCACVMGGGGECIDPNEKGNLARCMCLFGGAGT